MRAVSTRLAQCLAGLRQKAALNRLSIPSRLILLVLALAVPLNLVNPKSFDGRIRSARVIEVLSRLVSE